MEQTYNGMAYLAALLKNYYSPRMIEAVKLHRYIINYMEKYRQVEPMGANKVVGVEKSWVESVSPGIATSDLPLPLNPSGATLTIVPKHLYGTLMVWFSEEVYSNTDLKSFIRSQQKKLEGITNATKAEAEIYCYGDGGVTPRAVQPVADAAAVGTVVTINVDSTRLLRPSMPLDFYDNVGVAIANGVYRPVADVVSETQFTVDFADLGAGGAAAAIAFAAALVAGSQIYHAGGLNREPFGLEALIGTANNNIFTVNRALATNAWYRPRVFRIDAAGNMVAANGPSAAGTPLRSWDMKYLYQRIEQAVKYDHASKDKLAVFTTPSIRTKIVEDNRARGIAMPLSKKVDVWPEDTVEIDGVPIVASYLVRPGAIFIPALDQFTKYETTKLRWDTEGGMWKQAHNPATGGLIDAKEAYFREIYELSVMDPKQSSTIYDCEGAYD